MKRLPPQMSVTCAGLYISFTRVNKKNICFSVFIFTLERVMFPFLLIQFCRRGRKPTQQVISWPGVVQQVHCEDHRRDDAFVPHGNHQSVHQQPLASRAHLQTEEHQQVGANPAQPAVTVQVRCLPRGVFRTHTRKHTTLQTTSQTGD